MGTVNVSFALTEVSQISRIQLLDSCCIHTAWKVLPPQGQMMGAEVRKKVAPFFFLTAAEPLQSFVKALTWTSVFPSLSSAKPRSGPWLEDPSDYGFPYHCYHLGTAGSVLGGWAQCATLAKSFFIRTIQLL